MEDYLKEQYDVFEDKKWLIKEEDIEDYFLDNGREHFDCGQGYYQEEVELICKVGEAFYKVELLAEIESAKQDYGDRLYWVSRISNVSYERIEKPKKKEKTAHSYNLLLDEKQKKILENFLKENGIETL